MAPYLLASSCFVCLLCSVDFYGVFGILDPFLVEVLYFIAVGLLWIAVYVTIYHELLATLPFLGVYNFGHTRRLQLALSANCVIHFSFISTFFVEDRIYFLTLTIVSGLLYAIVMLVVVNTVLFSIWRHHNNMRKAQLRCYVG